MSRILESKERYGVIVRLPTDIQSGVIMDSEGEYFDFLYHDRTLCRSLDVKDPKKHLKLGQLVGFNRKESTEAKDIFIVNYN